MHLLVAGTSLFCLLHCTFGITINASTNEGNTKSVGSQDKRSLIIGDLSYSYAATDIGSDKGSHIKTITVIKNIAAPTFKKSPHNYNEDESSWDDNSKNRFNFVVKLPEFPHIDNFFHKDKPKTVIPTKQPTNRQTPVFETENDDQPTNINNDENVPQVYDASQDENSPDTLPNSMTLLNTSEKEGPVDSPANNDDVEYIQTNDDHQLSEISTAQPLLNQKDGRVRVGKLNGDQNSNVRQMTNEQKKLQNKLLSPDFLEDFSDYSMHNVRHLADPIKVKDSLLKYSQNEANRELKKLVAPSETVRKDQKYDSYGNVIEKSQSLLDATQPSRRPYLSPSIQKTYTRTSTESPATQSSSLATKSSDRVRFFSTTQKAYVAPKKLKNAQNVRADNSFVNPSTERIQQLTYSSSQFSEVNNQQQQQLQYAMQPQQVQYRLQTSYRSPSQQAFQQQNSKQEPEMKHEQQFQSYSIKNPLTTSLPVQHNKFKSQSNQHLPKKQGYIAVPLDAKSPTSHGSESSKIPKRFVRHHLVFNSKPPHPFMESPFQPVKTIVFA